MQKYTDEQIAEACAKYVDDWDIETLVTYAQEQMFIYMTEKAYASELDEFMEENNQMLKFLPEITGDYVAGYLREKL